MYHPNDIFHSFCLITPWICRRSTNSSLCSFCTSIMCCLATKKTCTTLTACSGLFCWCAFTVLLGLSPVLIHSSTVPMLPLKINNFIFSKLTFSHRMAYQSRKVRRPRVKVSSSLYSTMVLSFVSRVGLYCTALMLWSV